MLSFTLDMYQTAGVAMLLYVLGRFLCEKIDFLRKICIPAPVVGGLIFALVHLALYCAGIVELSFDDNVKSFFMTLFFTSVGYGSTFGVLKKVGKKGVIFLVVIVVVICYQDAISALLAGVFGWDLRLGLTTGSIPMIGGHGTAGSYGPLLEEMGITGANVVAVASATYGLVAGSLMGGPLANSLIKKYDLKPTGVQMEEIDTISADQKAKAERLDLESFTNAMIFLAVGAGVGTLLTLAFNSVKFNVMGNSISFTFPTYMGALVFAVIVRNICDAKKITLPMAAIDMWGNVSLSMFLAIALMSLKLWQLADLAIPMIVMLVVQTILMFVFARFIFFNVMGRDFDAAVMAAGLCGFGMGATPNAMANMQTVCKKWGPSPVAYVVVPMMGALFVDVFNGIIITLFINLLPLIG